jgi:hypothetical protein
MPYNENPNNKEHNMRIATKLTEELSQGMSFPMGGQEYVITDKVKLTEKGDHMIQFALVDPNIDLCGTLVIPKGLAFEVYLY